MYGANSGQADGGRAGVLTGISYDAIGPGRKTKEAVSHGIRGCIKSRIIRVMMDAIDDPHKILICDRTAAQVISSCLRMHELMEHGVVLVEDVMIPRQPIISSNALYFITPTEESVQAVMQDWQGRRPYKAAHIFFTSTASDRLVETIAGNPILVENTHTVKDMMLDFDVPESLFFHLGLPADISKLFPPEIALSGARENILGQISSKLISVFLTIGKGVPSIRYQASSRLSQKVARNFFDDIAKLSKDVPELKIGAANAETPLLIIVDRSFDAAAPLVHERTYQCLFNDLMPLVDGFYEQSYTDRNGTPCTRKCPIDELDPYWCEYRHQFFATCLTELPAKLNELLASNPSLSGAGQPSAQGKKGAKLDDVGSAVRALPEFQEKQAKLSMHIDICTKLMDRYKQQHLMEICEVEQDIASGAKAFRDLFELVRRWAADPSVPVNVRVRLILFFFASTDSRELTEAKRLQLIQDSGLSNEAARCAKLDMFISRVGRLQQEDLKKKGKDAANRSGGSSVTSTLRSLRMRRKEPDSGSSSGVGGASGTSVGGSEAAAGDSYRNQAYLILEAATGNTLSTTDFPLLNGAFSEMPSAQGGEVANRRTLRSGLGRTAANAGGGADAGGDRGASLGRTRDADAVLDLGFEGKVKLNAPQRIVLFVMGGVTYSEARAAYEISKKTGREVIVGGTSILSPENFLFALANLR